MAFWSIITLVPIIGVIVGIRLSRPVFAKQEIVRDWLAGYGRWGIVLFILLQIAQVIIAPLSHYTTSVLGGFLTALYGVEFITGSVDHRPPDCVRAGKETRTTNR